MEKSGNQAPVSWVDLEISSKEYHAQKGSYSSSQLKDILEDAEIFYKTHITRELGKEHVAAFDVGTYFHTLVLEPDKIEEECAVYDGVRRGKLWDSFLEKNPNKAILSPSQVLQAEAIAKVTLKSKVVREILEDSLPEVSAFLDILVDVEAKEIYTADLEFILGIDGWQWLGFDPVVLSEKSIKLRIKARADALLPELNSILDLKSTTGNTRNVFKVRKKISDYNYDLSASLYLDIFSMATGVTYDKFLWTFASKDKLNVKTYSASRANIQVGRAKWKKAAIDIAKYEIKGWVFEDTIDILEPEMYQLEWLKEK